MEEEQEDPSLADHEPAATHNSPRTWILTSALSPLAVRLIRQLLEHGDYVVACLPPQEIDDEDRGAEFRELIAEVKESNRKDRAGWKDRIRGIRCDGRSTSSCSAALVEAVSVFGRIDILLCCKSEGRHCFSFFCLPPIQSQFLSARIRVDISPAVVGTVEELATTPTTQNLMRHQFETIFFSQVNFIKAILPLFRKQHTGHIIILTSTGGHIGTPGMSAYSASVWALEGYCDSLAYEIAPFNIKLTIVQPNQETQSLTNHLTFAPPIPAYMHDFNPAPNLRDMLSNVLNTHPDTVMPVMPESADSPESVDSMSLEPEKGQGDIIRRYPKLPDGAADKLVQETVHALTAIGGHENPPSRHIVGYEGSTAVKEKLKTVTEELEDFVDASLAVDIFESELKQEAREGRTREGTPRDQMEVDD